ncbi:MAG: ferritin [Cyclobacteriaceae bacterium]|nr:ferritin [Cyclobacteriaceae bacterium HetDA_MAG_MS6]
MQEVKRRKKSLEDSTEKLLNEQIKIEATSAANYLAMASWCEQHGFANSAQYLLQQSEEERGHMLKFFTYVLEVGGSPQSPEVTNIKHNYESFMEIFETMLDQEIEVSKSINNVVDHCNSVKDHTTGSFMQWFVDEQREEEANARRALELFDVIGNDGPGRYLIDQEIAKIAKAAQAG